MLRTMNQRRFKRYLLPAMAVLPCVLVLGSNASWAATISINDQSELFTVTSTDSARLSVFSCGNGIPCDEINIAQPAGSTFLSSPLIPGGIHGLDSGIAVNILDNPTTLSDGINPVDIRILQAGNGFDFVFFSFESAVFPCVNPAGCETIQETGGVQTLGSVTWQFASGATLVDTIQFQSGEDAAPSPEPSTALLLLAGLTLLWLGKVGLTPIRR
jgi:hypothetical protein